MDLSIAKAKVLDKDKVLKILDEFRNECWAIIDNDYNHNSTSARDNGGELFDNMVQSNDCAIFLAKEDDDIMGILTIYKIPQIRAGKCRGEIEEMFVSPEYQGKNVAIKLIEEAVKWAKEQNLSSINLESSMPLKRAHSFYKKAGFTYYGKAFQKEIN